MLNLNPFISRKEAKALGLPRYFTGVPCKQGGHISERRTGCSECLECARKTKTADALEEARRIYGDKIVTKEEAKRRGLKQYFVGKVCGKGHVSDRNVSTNQCRQCLREYYRDKTLSKKTNQRVTKVHSIESAKMVVPSDLHSKIILKEEAEAKGLVRYFTGLPCARGHISERKVSSGDCLECKRDNHKRRLKEDPEFREKMRLTAKAFKKTETYAKNEARKKHQRMLLRNATHVSRMITKAQTVWWENPYQIFIDREKKRKWATERRRMVSLATPKWINIEDIRAMEKRARELSKQSGTQFQCDHFYPVQSDVVTGLNVPWNIQIITAEENHAKSNKMPENFYTEGEFNDRLVRCGRYDSCPV